MVKTLLIMILALLIFFIVMISDDIAILIGFLYFLLKSYF